MLFSQFECFTLLVDIAVGRGATSSSFWGGQFSWNFIRWRHRAYSTVVQLVHKWSQIKFPSQHFRKWELVSYNQDADRTTRTEKKLVA